MSWHADRYLLLRTPASVPSGAPASACSACSSARGLGPPLWKGDEASAADSPSGATGSPPSPLTPPRAAECPSPGLASWALPIAALGLGGKVRGCAAACAKYASVAGDSGSAPPIPETRNQAVQPSWLLSYRAGEDLMQQVAWLQVSNKAQLDQQNIWRLPVSLPPQPLTTDVDR